MPTVLEVEGFRFFFYSADRNEPPHIHVRKAGREAKFWLSPIRMARPGQFRASELRRIVEIVTEHEIEILERWYEYFND